MMIFAVIVVAAGIVINLVGAIWFLVAAFRKSVLWGLAVLFVPFAALIFLISNWSEVRTPFLLNLLAYGVMYAGIYLLGSGKMAPDAADASGGSAAGAEEAASGFSLSQTLETLRNLPEERRERKRIQSGNYVGLTLVEVEEKLGPPKGKIEVGSRVIYKYNGMELISGDGETVTEEILR